MERVKKRDGCSANRSNTGKRLVVTLTRDGTKFVKRTKGESNDGNVEEERTCAKKVEKKKSRINKSRKRRVDEKTESLVRKKTKVADNRKESNRLDKAEPREREEAKTRATEKEESEEKKHNVKKKRPESLDKKFTKNQERCESYFKSKMGTTKDRKQTRKRKLTSKQRKLYLSKGFRKEAREIDFRDWNESKSKDRKSKSSKVRNRSESTGSESCYRKSRKHVSRKSSESSNRRSRKSKHRKSSESSDGELRKSKARKQSQSQDRNSRRSEDRKSSESLARKSSRSDKKKSEHLEKKESKFKEKKRVLKGKSRKSRSVVERNIETEELNSLEGSGNDLESSPETFGFSVEKRLHRRKRILRTTVVTKAEMIKDVILNRRRKSRLKRPTKIKIKEPKKSDNLVQNETSNLEPPKTPPRDFNLNVLNVPHRGKLPDWRHAWYSEVVHVDNTNKCGLLRLSPINGHALYCMFMVGAVWPRIAEESMSDSLCTGQQFKANIKLVNSQHAIPYVATDVWPGHVDVPPNIETKLHVPLTSPLKCAYLLFSAQLSDLAHDAAAGGVCQHECAVFCPVSGCGVVLQNVLYFWQHVVDSHLAKEVLGELAMKQISVDTYMCPMKFCSFTVDPDDSEGCEQRENFVSHLKLEHFHIFKDRLKSRYPIFYIENEAFLHSYKDFIARKETVVQKAPKVIETGKQGNIEEISAVEKAKVRQYFDETSGLLELSSDKSLVLFSINQVWLMHSVIGMHRFDEIHATKELQEKFPVGSEVFCKTRPIPSPEVKLQAIFVSQEHTDPPAIEKTEIFDLLDIMLEKYKTLIPLCTPKLGPSSLQSSRIHPDFISQPLQGMVQEHIDPNSGLIKVFSEDSVILFCHYQLQENISSRSISAGSKDFLRCELPIGTTVTVYVRKIPAHDFSHLKYQALFLVKGIVNNLPTLEEMFNKEHGSLDDVFSTISELDKNYDVFKQSVRLWSKTLDQLSIVPVLVDCLPFNWQAVVELAINEEIGIIRMHKADGSEIAILGQEATSHSLYAVFHISDVHSSQSLFGSESVCMASIVGCQVNLRARSVTTYFRPSEILTEVKKFSFQYKTENIRTLQAVQVYLKQTSNDKLPKELPRPTVLRASPGSFNSSSCTAYFCNSSLKFNLDRKIADYLRTIEGRTKENYRIRLYYEHLLNCSSGGTVRYAKGRVLKVLTREYGVGTLFLKDGNEGGRHQEVLFDICDVWIGSRTCAEVGISLKQLVQPGDFIKCLCLPVERINAAESSKWNFCYLATSVVTSAREDTLDNIILPHCDVNNIYNISKEKVENFQTVTRHIERKIAMEQKEEALIDEVLCRSKVRKPYQFVIEENDRAVVWKKGKLVHVLSDELGIIRFEKKTGQQCYTTHALFHRQSLYRNINSQNTSDVSCGKMKMFLKPGFPLRFNGFRPSVEEHGHIIEFYASSVMFDHLGMHLHDLDLYLDCGTLDTDTSRVEQSCTNILRRSFTTLSKYFENDRIGIECRRRLDSTLPRTLFRLTASILYVNEDFLLCQVEIGMGMVVYGMYMFDGKLREELHPGAGVCVEGVLVHPCGGVQYLIFSISKEQDKDWGHQPRIDTSQETITTIEKFHLNLVKVYHLPQIFNIGDVESILSPLLPAPVARDIMLEYYAQVGNGLVDLNSLTNETMGLDIHTIRLFILCLGYICFTSSASQPSPRFNGMILTPEVVLRLRSSVLPMVCLCMVDDLSEYDFGVSEDVSTLVNWSTEKDVALFKKAVLHSFSWNSLISDKGFPLRDELTDEDGVKPAVLARFLEFVNGILVSNSIKVLE